MPLTSCFALLIGIFLFASKIALCDDKVSIPAQSTCKATPPAITSSCYPSLVSDIEFPNTTITGSERPGWWCQARDEYGWLGFSYDVGHCPSEMEMSLTFNWMKRKKNARYVRIYSNCDQDSFNKHLINAAATAQIGVYALIWFGFQGDSVWRTRKENLLKAIRENILAPYTIRAVTLGSEPLYDGVLDVKELSDELKKLASELEPYWIPVTISEMTYGFQINDNAPSIFEAMDLVSLNVLPVFDSHATTSNLAWNSVEFCINYGKLHGKGKPVVITQTGWPSNKDQAGNSKATTDIRQEKNYFDLLSDHCEYFKEQGVGWFAHIFAENSLSGWGVVLENSSEKFPFNPLTNC
ncbi:uncharacterized protein MELLADRAFT_32383 [Melampsora larici-populina 98AG31]|uniref:glucan endo-1,3-beta-D-glucosidase n=1 Tax=Melampsora larici-populina (strain 98AG31 / pathotype 3-4-7) TaxID=747676 RepID=F4R3Q2_MELLP|nr:uncharacterized protein MELLADRAFT_32383 [Melampsora larici-populina 98AG31]EGG12669.1 hypothetical protein MELLADRAFT_32383 [Melampsora larici-populina 98AG31]